MKITPYSAIPETMLTVDMTKIGDISIKPNMKDEVVFSDNRLTEYYTNYKNMADQIKEKPATLTDIIYNHMSKEEAEKVLSFLDGKNVTTFRYQHLLEVNPDKAAIFLKSLTEFDCYDDACRCKDKAVENMSYEDFLTDINKHIVESYKDKVTGGKMHIHHMLNLSEEAHKHFMYEGFCKTLNIDFRYGERINGIKTSGFGTHHYLLTDNKTWLNSDEYGKLMSSPAFNDGNNDYLPYEETALPVGYENKDTLKY